MMEIFQIWIVVIVPQLYELTENHLSNLELSNTVATSHSGYLNFNSLKLYHYKAMVFKVVWYRHQKIDIYLLINK